MTKLWVYFLVRKMLDDKWRNVNVLITSHQ